MLICSVIHQMALSSTPPQSPASSISALTLILEVYEKSRYALRRTIKQAKRQCRTKIESYYTVSDIRRMWQGLKTTTDYKGKPSCELPSDASLPGELHAFYARFEASNTEACMRAPAVPDDCVMTV
ncbi:unnamed protein product [Oncorhynchus mykiss]|uniref:Uncharacterized protein n=1 Tax=Oncorhynchus mykiss TaxID=8022 RepID=A0A060YXD2_ONCMY|nr:unnamed protein product [Oncorhynchus mykiss]